MKHFRLALMGFGNVGRRLVQLLSERRAQLENEEGITFTLAGLSTRTHGFLTNVSAEKLLAGDFDGTRVDGLDAWLEAVKPDVVFEATSSNPVNGQPAITHVLSALNHGAHVVTANKGITIHGWDEVQAACARANRRFLFEASVMGGSPVFSLFRETRPLQTITRIRAVLNATSTVVLEGIASGLSFAESVKKAQALGVAETDPSADVDGWDAALKITAIAKVLMKARLSLKDVPTTGIRAITPDQMAAARADGKSIRMVARAERAGDRVTASVAPEAVPLSDPLGAVTGTDLVLQIETDLVPSLTLTAKRGGPMPTAYDMLADFVTIARATR